MATSGKHSPGSARRSTAERQVKFPIDSATKPINLALQGGGSHGAFTWGVLDRLLEDGRVSFDGICGTSAGAMNAVLVAHGLMHGGHEGARASLAKFWESVGKLGAMLNPIAAMAATNPLKNAGVDPVLAAQQWAAESFTRTFSPYQFNPMNVNPLRDLLESCVDFEALRHCGEVKLFLCATNVRSGKVRIFNNSAMSVDAVMASACLPHLFQAVEIDGEHYWDGGYVGNPALYPLFYETATRDVVVVMVNQMWRDDVPTTPAEIEDRVNEISFNSSLMREMRAVEFVSRQLGEGWLKPEYARRMRHVLVHLIRADAFMGTLSAATKISTDMQFLAGLRDLGRASAGQWLNEHHDAIGKRGTVDLRKEFLD
ncbi:patatin-like phospholipase family protein [Dokdonella sp.]|uniref:patatin-like phospholipase family protein n=1 Tax=Dokdonella sp. TaxID=2291710 RepID=UPI003528F619